MEFLLCSDEYDVVLIDAKGPCYQNDWFICNKMLKSMFNPRCDHWKFIISIVIIL